MPLNTEEMYVGCCVYLPLSRNQGVWLGSAGGVAGGEGGGGLVESYLYYWIFPGYGLPQNLQQTYIDYGRTSLSGD